MIAPSYRGARSSEPSRDQSSELGRPCFLCPPTTGCQRGSGRRALDTRPATFPSSPSSDRTSSFSGTILNAPSTGIHTHRIVYDGTASDAVSGEVMRGGAVPYLISIGQRVRWGGGAMRGHRAVIQCSHHGISKVPGRRRQRKQSRGFSCPVPMFVYRSCFQSAFTANLLPEGRARRFGMTLSSPVMHLFWASTVCDLFTPHAKGQGSPPFPL